MHERCTRDYTFSLIHARQVTNYPHDSLQVTRQCVARCREGCQRVTIRYLEDTRRYPEGYQTVARCREVARE